MSIRLMGRGLAMDAGQAASLALQYAFPVVTFDFSISSPSFLHNREQRRTSRCDLWKERFGGCRHDASTHTTDVQIVVGVYSSGVRVPVKQFDWSIIRQFRSANKPFYGERSIESGFFLCATAFCASIP